MTIIIQLSLIYPKKLSKDNNVRFIGFYSKNFVTNNYCDFKVPVFLTIHGDKGPQMEGLADGGASVWATMNSISKNIMINQSIYLFRESTITLCYMQFHSI